MEGFLILSILPSTTILILKGTRRTIDRKNERKKKRASIIFAFSGSSSSHSMRSRFVFPSSSLPSGSPGRPPPSSHSMIHLQFLFIQRQMMCGHEDGCGCGEGGQARDLSRRRGQSLEWIRVVSECCIKDIRFRFVRPTLRSLRASIEKR